MEKNVVLVVGAGKVGKYAVEHLARTSSVNKLVVVDIEKEAGMNTINDAIISSAIYDHYPNIRFVRLNVLDVKETAKLLREIKPTVILNTATLLSSYTYIPIAKRRIKELGLALRSHVAGHTLAKDLVPIYKLMQAVREAEIEARVVNIAFPDHTNAVLSKVGLSPTVGAGTIDLTVNGVRKAVADKFNVPMRSVQVMMVAHHAVRVYPIGDVPFFIKVIVDGNDLTNKLDKIELLNEAIKTTMGVNPAMTAASGVRNVMAILNDERVLRHSPGAKGLPGGYPLRIGMDEIEVVLPQELTMEEAMRINDIGMKMDGIERIDPDGTVTFTKEAIMLMEEVLGLTGWGQMRLSEAEDMAKQLVDAYIKLANYCNKKLKSYW